jgi:hypothetical protein
VPFTVSDLGEASASLLLSRGQIAGLSQPDEFKVQRYALGDALRLTCRHRRSERRVGTITMSLNLHPMMLAGIKTYFLG